MKMTKRIAILALVLLFSALACAETLAGPAGFGSADAPLFAVAGKSDRYDLSNFGYRPVQTGGRGELVFQTKPRGSFMKNHKFWDGDQIYVNLYWRDGNYAIAYENGEYGYVDATYINWNAGKSSGGSSYDSKKDLANYEWRRVNTHGQGALVFQKKPRGAFIKSHSFWDGDQILVNVYWRQNGYAIAYEDGVYGYVDASYIDW